MNNRSVQSGCLDGSQAVRKAFSLPSFFFPLMFALSQQNEVNVLMVKDMG